MNMSLSLRRPARQPYAGGTAIGNTSGLASRDSVQCNVGPAASRGPRISCAYSSTSRPCSAYCHETSGPVITRYHFWGCRHQDTTCCYRVFRDGLLVDGATDIRTLWRDDPGDVLHWLSFPSEVLLADGLVECVT